MPAFLPSVPVAKWGGEHSDTPGRWTQIVGRCCIMQRCHCLDDGSITWILEGGDILIDVLKLSDNLAKPHVRLADTSGLDPSREHGLLPPSNIIGASTPANSLVGHVGF